MYQARLWRPLGGTKVQCRLCSHFCAVDDGERGKCGVRANLGGRLFTLVYDRIAAVNVDPVEKKPLFHFHPGHRTFSLATMGCNLQCDFCQNADISQPPREGRTPAGQGAAPEQLVEAALDAGAASISYTYTEPTIFFELMQDTARLARERGLMNIMVSNGFMSTDCLDNLKDTIDAANIDLKSFNDDFHREHCGSRLAPVLDNLKKIVDMGWWLEVTTLVITGLNDSEEELDKMARFIARELGPQVPWHVSRFHPCYRMTDRPSTPVETVERAAEIGREAGLKYVYSGNIPGDDHESTYCPECRTRLIERYGFSVRSTAVRSGCCPECGLSVEGEGMSAENSGGNATVKAD